MMCNKRMFCRIVLSAALLLHCAVAAFAQDRTPPKSWVDPDTGHRVLRIADEPNSASLYFNDNAYTSDGKSMIYTTPNGISVIDLQTPKGEDFWLASYHLPTGKRTWYHMQRNEWSIHFNVTHDGSLFCGDGGDPGQVAHAPDGEWIYLFHPELKKWTGLITTT